MWIKVDTRIIVKHPQEGNMFKAEWHDGEWIMIIKKTRMETFSAPYNGTHFVLNKMPKHIFVKLIKSYVTWRSDCTGHCWANDQLCV